MFLHVSLLLSPCSYYTTFLDVVVDIVKALGPPRLYTVDGGRQGHVVCKAFLSQHIPVVVKFY